MCYIIDSQQFKRPVDVFKKRLREGGRGRGGLLIQNNSRRILRADLRPAPEHFFDAAVLPLLVQLALD